MIVKNWIFHALTSALLYTKTVYFISPLAGGKKKDILIDEQDGTLCSKIFDKKQRNAVE